MAGKNGFINLYLKTAEAPVLPKSPNSRSLPKKKKIKIIQTAQNEAARKRKRKYEERRERGARRRIWPTNDFN